VTQKKESWLLGETSDLALPGGGAPHLIPCTISRRRETSQGGFESLKKPTDLTATRIKAQWGATDFYTRAPEAMGGASTSGMNH